jgi:RNA polymerase sigma factor (sigma-70 family)
MDIFRQNTLRGRLATVPYVEHLGSPPNPRTEAADVSTDEIIVSGPSQPGGPMGPSDAELLTSVRAGDSSAYSTLFERHVGSARALGIQLTGHRSDADDLVSEAFTRILRAVTSGGGPTVALRPYLLTTLRRVHYDRSRAAKRVQTVDDLTPFDPGVPFVDSALAGLERTLVARAFSQLPERWQMVLWHTEVEEASPAEIAPLLGLTPNSVSALAYRAREGLRQAYLQVHLSAPRDQNCRAIASKLGAYARNALSRRESEPVQRHLEDCEDCRGLYLELTEVGAGMRSVIAPLILGAAVLGYLKALVATGVVGAVAAGGSAGTAGTGATAAGTAATTGASTGTAAAAGTAATAATTTAAAGSAAVGTAAAAGASVLGYRRGGGRRGRGWRLRGDWHHRRYRCCRHDHDGGSDNGSGDRGRLDGGTCGGGGGGDRCWVRRLLGKPDDTNSASATHHHGVAHR